MDSRITEHSSKHRHLERKTVDELVELINKEDETVAGAIQKARPQISRLIQTTVEKLRTGGRFFYVGAGSGGRLAVLDVIELPTTYGLPKGIFNVVLAGGVDRLVEALEEHEDDTAAGWLALQEANINTGDMVVGISASGTTPFVLAALTQCRQHGITTGCIVSNPNSPIAAQAGFPLEIITGPEVVTGSNRMK